MGGQMDRWMEGWMDGKTDGWLDRRQEERVYEVRMAREKAIIVATQTFQFTTGRF
jgi:hypothetical protein